MATVGRLAIEIDARTQKMQAGLARTEKLLTSSVARQNRTLRGLERGFGRVTRGAGLLGVSLGAVFSAQAIKSQFQYADDLRNTADKLGLTTEALQELRFAGEEVGVSTNTTDMALQRFTRRLAEAQQGTGEMRGTLERLNIEIRNSDGSARSSIEVFEDLADAVAASETAQDQLLAAFKGFDSEGAALVNLLRRGSIGLDEFRQRARDLGVVIADDTIDQLADMNRELDVLGQWVSVNGTKVLGFYSGMVNDALRAVGALPRSISREISLMEDFLELTEGLDGLPFIGERRETAAASIAELRRELAALDRNNGGDGSGPLPFASDEQFDRATEAAQRRIQSLRDEISVLAGHSPEAVEVARLWDDIERSFERSGVRLTGEQRAEFGSILNLYRSAAEEVARMEQGIDAAATAQKRAADSARDWGLAINSAFADAIFNARSFGGIFDALLRKIAQSALFGADGASGLLGGFTASIGAGLGDLFSFANGGIMTSAGSVPLKKYASGGIANSPQLALYGEGSTPEAYVPLPDGRAIPVKMDGMAPSVTIVQNFPYDVQGTVRTEWENLAPEVMDQFAHALNRNQQGVV